MILLLTLNIFYTFFWCFYSWLRTSKCYMGKEPLKMKEIGVLATYVNKAKTHEKIPSIFTEGRVFWLKCSICNWDFICRALLWWNPCSTVLWNLSFSLNVVRALLYNQRVLPFHSPLLYIFAQWEAYLRNFYSIKLVISASWSYLYIEFSKILFISQKLNLGKLIFQFSVACKISCICKYKSAQK